jgi:hypothetical protein
MPLKAWRRWDCRKEFKDLDHQCIKNYFTLRCKKVSEKRFEEDYTEIIGASKNFLDCAKTGCKME